MGDRWCHLAFARHRLGGRPSPVYESAPVGGPPQRAYLNGVLEVEWAEDPLALLDACQAIEDVSGRERGARWGPRTLDLDLIAVGPVSARTNRLELPHPRALKRAFVVRPLLDLAPRGIPLPAEALLRARSSTSGQACRLAGPWPVLNEGPAS